MTNERSFPHQRLGPIGPNGGRGVCPDPEMLSAYLDGKLDATQRGPIEEHISRCEDCYFVVRESALALVDLEGGGPDQRGTVAPGATTARAEAQPGPDPRLIPLPLPGPQAPVPEPNAPKGRHGSSHLNRYLLPLAAVLVVGAGVMTLWRQGQRREPYADAVRPLVEAVGERRFFEPRLTGGFRFGPMVTSKRSSASGSQSEAWAMLAVAGEMRDRPEPVSIGARATRTAAALFLGHVDQAVAEYSQLVMDEPASAEWPSNLAAALLVRASTGAGTAERDGAEALRYAERAVSLNPSLGEARFNRSLALQALGRVDEARRSFTEIAARGDSWSAAARDQLRGLSEGAAPRP